MIVEQSKEERESKAPKIYLGNVKIVWTDGTNVAAAPRTDAGGAQQYAPPSAPEDDLPF